MGRNSRKDPVLPGFPSVRSQGRRWTQAPLVPWEGAFGLPSMPVDAASKSALARADAVCGAMLDSTSAPACRCVLRVDQSTLMGAGKDDMRESVERAADARGSGWSNEVLASGPVRVDDPRDPLSNPYLCLQHSVC